MLANVAFLAHVLVPHHHHGAVPHHSCEVLQEWGLDFDHNDAECPQEEHGTLPEKCIIAEANIFLINEYRNFTFTLLCFALTSTGGENLLPSPFCSDNSYTNSYDAFIPLKAISLPSGLRAPPVC